jgi:subtilisin family serine protease
MVQQAFDDPCGALVAELNAGAGTVSKPRSRWGKVRIEYYSGGRKHRVNFESAAPAAPVRLAFAAGPLDAFAADGADEAAPVFVNDANSQTKMLLTPSISLGDPKGSEVQWLIGHYGFQIQREGLNKVLLSAPLDVPDRERFAANVAVEVVERGNVASAQPNFVRVTRAPPLTDAAVDVQWALDNPGNPGVVGADVAATAAWTINTGSADIKVAVLDDGVESAHPALNSAVVAQRNFVDKTDDASPPSPMDYHGTACAGIIASRDPVVRGLAHGVSLIACRIGTKSAAGWLTEDYDVADGIDWCWQEAGADVLSMSFSGGRPSDLITQALISARTKGRNGKGCPLIAAAGNSGGSVVYPANLDEVFAVGATNQWDERKTKVSKDGETNWASNFGKGLSLMAPGVKVVTTDLTGIDGREPGPINGRFNGTSAATPFVSATAALILSERNNLSELEVRQILQATADSLGPTKWNAQVGFGRLNAFNALRAARKR